MSDPYLCVLERGADNWSGHAVDLPVAAVGESREEVLRFLAEGLTLQINRLREAGSPVPAPTTTADQERARLEADEDPYVSDLSEVEFVQVAPAP